MLETRGKEILRFIFAGGAGFVVDYGLLFLLTEYGKIPYLWSAGISFSVSVLFNYWLCVVYVFAGAQKQTARQKALFFGSSAAGLGLNQLCMWFFVEIVGIYYLIAKLFAAGIVMIWNYILKRKAVYAS